MEFCSNQSVLICKVPNEIFERDGQWKKKVRPPTCALVQRILKSDRHEIILEVCEFDNNRIHD